ncbi:MAG: oligosaccharide flippase family protein [Candidatus Marinimicrobia bacterium]|nr:oligosaccharide flippase family protein [Candidatus Neomarinimicrobiota bacterium]
MFFVTFAGNLWLVRLLVPEDFGIFALALSVVEIVSILGGLGISLACIQLQDEPDVFDTGHLLAWGLALALALLGLATAGILRTLSFYSSTVINFIAVLAPINALTIPASVHIASMDRALSFRRSALSSSVGPVVGIGLALALALYGGGVWSLLCKQVAASGIGFLVAVQFSQHSFRFAFHKSTALKIWKYSVNMFFQRMSEILTSRLPNFLLGTIAGIGVLGFFERSKYLSQLQNTILDPFFGKVAFATYSKVRTDKHKISIGLELNLFWSARIAIVTGVLVFFFPDLIITTVLGNQWSGAAEYFRGLSLYIAAISLFSPMVFALMAQGRMFIITLSNLFGLGIILVGIWLAWYLGGHWVLVPWFISAGTIVGVVMLGFSTLQHGLKIRWLRILGLPALLVLISTFMWILGNSYTEWQVLVAIIILLVGIVVIVDRHEIKFLLSKLK